MMKRRELKQYLDRTITVNELKEINDYDYAIKSIQKGTMNIHYVYDVKFALKHNNLANVTIFETNDRILLFVRTEDASCENTLIGKWSEACISQYYHISSYRGYVLGSNRHDDYARSLLSCIQSHQYKLKRAQLENRHDKDKAKIDAVMKTVPKLPNQFDKWVKTTVFKDYGYMYFKKTGKTISGYCTACNSEVSLSNAVHNSYDICPNCKMKVGLKAEGKSKNVHDTTWFYILQKAGENIVIRGFVGTKLNGTDYRNPKYTYNEQIREFITPNGEYTVYEINKYKNTSEYRWCRGIKYTMGNRYSKDAFLHSGACYVYSRNLSKVIKNTVWQYSGLVEYMRLNKFKDRPCQFLIKYLELPVIEQLSKVGLLKMVNTLIFNSHIRTYDNIKLDTTKTNFVEFIGVKKRWIKQIIDLNMNFEELHIYKTLLETYSFTDASGNIVEPTFSNGQVKLVFERFGAGVIKVLHSKGVSITRACNYITKQLNILKESSGLIYPLKKITNFWSDYLFMIDKTVEAARLNNAEIEEFPIFPKNIKQAHDELVGIYKDAQFEIHNTNIKQRAPEWEKYVYSNEKYIIVPPKNAYDLVNESNSLNHCVKIYADRVASGRTLILFVRDTEDINKPLYTLEYDEKKQKQLQFRGKGNGNPSKEAMDFIQEWEVFVKERVFNKEESEFNNQWREMYKKNTLAEQEVQYA